jgi:preprotein translocase subunit SecE
VNAFLQELFHVGLYKRTQGRITRQVTFVAVAVALAAGLFRLHSILGTALMNWDVGLGEGMNAAVRQSVRHGVPFLLLVLGLWATYRLVNVPVFADFLIAVEAEMNKVSWPTRAELYRSSIVVLVTIFALAVLLFSFDFFWKTIFTWLQIL